MKAILILFVFLLMGTAAAENASIENASTVYNMTLETGIVLNASDYVQYKYYQTATHPILKPGEYIVPYENINSVLGGAKYNGVSFVNPEPPVYPVTEYEEKLIAVAATGLDPITQAAISAATGAGAAYLVVKRRRKE